MSQKGVQAILLNIKETCPFRGRNRFLDQVTGLSETPVKGDKLSGYLTLMSTKAVIPQRSGAPAASVRSTVTV